jgi:hypothetical protein
MKDESGIQDQLLQQLQGLGIPASKTESFPPDIGIQIRLLIIIQGNSGIEYRLGPYIDYASTEGRIDYKDYSGEIKVDQVFNAISVGITSEMKFALDDNFYLSPTFSMPVIFGSLHFTSDTRVGDKSASNGFEFLATAFGLQPGISLSYEYSDFTLGLNASYLLCFSSSYTLNSNNDVILMNESGLKAGIGMTGPRLAFILGYNF